MKNNKYLKTIGLLSVVLLLAAILISNGYIPQKADAYSYLKGDYDGNGVVDPADARLTLRASVGLEEMWVRKTMRADVDEDGNLTPADARLILRISVGLEQLVTVDVTEPGETEPPTVPTLYVDNLGHEWGETKEELIEMQYLCRYCEKVDCISLPINQDGHMNLGYLCPEYDMSKDPNPDYNKVCRYCGKTDCITLQRTEYGGILHWDEECPKYDINKDPRVFCETCGRHNGDGTNGTCVTFNVDTHCPNCGEYCKAWTCHTCKN